MWTDKQTENSTFPHPLDAGGKNILRAAHGFVVLTIGKQKKQKNKNAYQHCVAPVLSSSNIKY